jgi:hypothetical protein
MLSCALPPLLLVIWLWGFGYIAGWLYSLLLPTVGFLGMAWDAGIAYRPAADLWLRVLSLIAFSLTVLWFRSSFDWSFLWVVAAAIMSCLIGNGIGYSIGSEDFAPIEWIKPD